MADQIQPIRSCQTCGRTRLPLVRPAKGGMFCPLCHERGGHLTPNTLPMRELAGPWGIDGEPGLFTFGQIERRLDDGTIHPDAVLFPYEVRR